MIAGFLLKIVVGLALVGTLLFEAVGPLIVRGQLDGTAHDTANAAAFQLRDGRDAAAAEAAAREVAGEKLKEFGIGEDGVVHVRLVQEAESIVAKRYVKQLRSWFTVEVEASASSR